MLDMEREREKDLRRSEAIQHFNGERDMTAEKTPRGYRPDWSEEEERTRPRELLNISNSYGSVSFAVNRNKEMTLFANEERRHNSKTLKNEHKTLDAKRKKVFPYFNGNVYTNNHNPVKSAFAFKTDGLYPQRILDRLKSHTAEQGQDALEHSIPFVTLDRDKKKLHELEAEIRRTPTESRELVRERERLAALITQKEQMQTRFVRKLRLAIKKAHIVSGGEETSVGRVQMHAAENRPDNEDLPEDFPHDGVPGETEDENKNKD